MKNNTSRVEGVQCEKESSPTEVGECSSIFRWPPVWFLGIFPSWTGRDVTNTVKARQALAWFRDPFHSVGWNVVELSGNVAEAFMSWPRQWLSVKWKRVQFSSTFCIFFSLMSRLFTQIFSRCRRKNRGFLYAITTIKKLIHALKFDF